MSGTTDPAGLPKLPSRPAEAHKGTFGTVCVIGGQAAAPRVMLGGPAFAAVAALRAGAGLAVLAVPAPLMAAALAVAPSATGLTLPVDDKRQLQPSRVAEILDQHLHEYDCVAVGPGLGADEPQQQVLARLIAGDGPAMVIDADALNALASLTDFARELCVPAVLTPHPGEFKRLASALGITHDPVDPASRPKAAASLAQRLGCVVALKGAGTIVSDGINTWTNPSGNVALATAGTGDVLTGVIAAIVAQDVAGSCGLGLFDCTRLGVYVHGLAADRWSADRGETGMLAADLLDRIPDVIEALRG